MNFFVLYRGKEREVAEKENEATHVLSEQFNTGLRRQQTARPQPSPLWTRPLSLSEGLQQVGKKNCNDLHFLLIWKVEKVRDTDLCQWEVSLTRCSGDWSVVIALLPWVNPERWKNMPSKQSKIKLLISRRGQYVSWGCHSSQTLTTLKCSF